MPKIRYAAHAPILTSKKHLKIVEQANQIITAYQSQGFDLTLRQLYYQFVSRDWLENTKQSYNRLGEIIVDARMAGLIDWNAIVDRTRNLASLSHWNDPPQIVDAIAQQFRIDKWARQPNRIEVWIEKEALAGVFERVCEELDVPYFCCRGYTSVSEMWAAGQRLKRYSRKQTPIILHFGDHDPSGIDMSRDIADRLATFAGINIDVNRLALNMDQVQQYDPPPNPAKTSDSRYANYIAAYGDESWELDALEPAILAELVRTAVAGFRDEDLWQEAEDEEAEGRRQLTNISERYDDVVAFLE